MSTELAEAGHGCQKNGCKLGVNWVYLFPIFAVRMSNLKLNSKSNPKSNIILSLVVLVCHV